MAILRRGSTRRIAGCARAKPNRSPTCWRNLLDLDVDASSISYITGWSHADPTILATAAGNVLRAVNTIAAGLGLDNADAAADVANVA